MFKGYYFITDSRLSQKGNYSDVCAALSAGVGVVQYRNKDASTREMYDEASQLRELCRGVLFLVNDRMDIALSVNADGIHLGQTDLPYSTARRILGQEKTIGLTVHSLQEAHEAYRLGADYLGVSPIFATKTKQDACLPVGVEVVRTIRRHIPLPLVAIGGINLSNAPEVIEAGADCVCALSAVLTQPDVKREIERFQSLF